MCGASRVRVGGGVRAAVGCIALAPRALGLLAVLAMLLAVSAFYLCLPWFVDWWLGVRTSHFNFKAIVLWDIIKIC